MSQISHFCGVKLLAWKSGCVKFWTNIKSAYTYNTFCTKNHKSINTRLLQQLHKYVRGIMGGKNLVHQVSQVVNEWLENCVKNSKNTIHRIPDSPLESLQKISSRSKLEFCMILMKPLSAFGPGLCKELSPVPYFQYWCISLPFLEPFSFSIQGWLNDRSMNTQLKIVKGTTDPSYK